LYNQREGQIQVEQQKAFIVKKLFLHQYIGGKHTAIENLKKGLPGHLRGSIKNAVHELVKEEVLLLKPTSYGLHVSLNPQKREAIEHYLQ